MAGSVLSVAAVLMLGAVLGFFAGYAGRSYVSYRRHHDSHRY
jgi:hypothetical protein